jgi:hypothetical protein
MYIMENSQAMLYLAYPKMMGIGNMSFKIRDLADILFIRDDKALFAVLSAYFDRSTATGKAASLTCVAGYVAPLDEWQRVESAWSEALAEWRIDRFHFAELPNVPGVGQERANQCIKFFSRIVRESGVFAIGSAVVDDEWHLPDWGHDTSERFSSPYEKALDSALRLLGEHAKERWPGEPLNVVCDRDAEPETIVRAFSRRQERHSNLADLTIHDRSRRLANSPELRAMECADLAVGCLRKSWLQIMAGELEDDMWGSLPRPEGPTAKTSIWCLKPAWFIQRSLAINQRRISGRQSS